MSATEQDDDNIRMIRDSAAAVAPPGGDLRRIRKLRFQSPGFDRAVWAEICALGWPGLLVPEERGGAGLGMREFCALVEELGGGLVPEPLIQAAFAARLLNGDALATVLSGERIVLPASQERANTLCAALDTRFETGRISGKKLFVPHAAGADAFLVTTRDGLALVERGAAGLDVDLSATQDGGEFGTLMFDGTPAEAVDGNPAQAFEEATLATAAYLLGAMDRVFAMTLDYLRTRQQFGRTIGSFQVLQHKAADVKIQIELTRATIGSAAAAIDSGVSVAATQAAVSRAKARASEAASFVTRQAIQLHGGIGYTDEYDAGLYLRKCMVLAGQFGSAAVHRARFARIAGDDDDESEG